MRDLPSRLPAALVFSVVVSLMAGCSHDSATPQVDQARRSSSMHAPVGCVQPPANMVSWWPGDGNPKDIVGSNPGTLINGVTFGPGKVLQAFVLNGIGQYVDVGNGATLHVSSGDFTIDAWVRFKALTHPPGKNQHGAPQGDMSIADKMRAVNGVPNVDGWRLLKQDDNRFWFCLGGGAANGCGDQTYTVFSTTHAAINTWYFVAVVKSAATFSIFVNGAMQDSRATPAFSDQNKTDMLLGANPYESARLNGKIDEVELFDRALSATEIQSIYKAGSAGKCKP